MQASDRIVDQAAIDLRMKAIRHKVLVLAGKGGIQPSTIDRSASSSHDADVAS